MIYQHWIGTLTPDGVDDEEEPEPRPLDVWLPEPAPLRASRFEREPWPLVTLTPLVAPGGCFAGTVEYWFGDDEEE